MKHIFPAGKYVTLPRESIYNNNFGRDLNFKEITYLSSLFMESLVSVLVFFRCYPSNLCSWWFLKETKTNNNKNDMENLLEFLISVYVKIDIYFCNFYCLARIAFFNFSPEFSNHIRS